MESSCWTTTAERIVQHRAILWHSSFRIDPVGQSPVFSASIPLTLMNRTDVAEPLSRALASRPNLPSCLSSKPSSVDPNTGRQSRHVLLGNSQRSRDGTMMQRQGILSQHVRSPRPVGEDATTGGLIRQRELLRTTVLLRRRQRVAVALAYAYRQESAVDIRVARILNVYGPGTPASDERAISSFISGAIGGENLVVNGHGTATRCFQHVDDCVAVLMKIDWGGDPSDIGSDIGMKIGELAELVAGIVSSTTGHVWASIECREPLPDESWSAKATWCFGKELAWLADQESSPRRSDAYIMWHSRHAGLEDDLSLKL